MTTIYSLIFVPSTDGAPDQFMKSGRAHFENLDAINAFFDIILDGVLNENALADLQQHIAKEMSIAKEGHLISISTPASIAKSGNDIWQIEKNHLLSMPDIIGVAINSILKEE